MRVIVCGSRTWTDRKAIEDRLGALMRESLGKWTDLFEPPGTLTVVHGACEEGADAFARDWCRYHWGTVFEEAHPANWDEYGRKAGPIRNSVVASKGADLCLAFRMPGKSNGTDDMVRKARAAGIPVEVIGG